MLSLRLWKISTPDADVYKEAYFVVDLFKIVYSSLPDMKGKLISEVDQMLTSVWKLWSTEQKDNVYPKTEQIELF